MVVFCILLQLLSKFKLHRLMVLNCHNRISINLQVILLVILLVFIYSLF